MLQFQHFQSFATGEKPQLKKLLDPHSP